MVVTSLAVLLPLAFFLVRALTRSAAEKKLVEELGYDYDLEAPIPYRENGLWGFLDTNGKVIVEPEYVSVTPYKGKYALATTQDSEKSYYTYQILLDRSGEAIFDYRDDPEVKLSWQNGNRLLSINGQLYDKDLRPLSYTGELRDCFEEGYYTTREYENGIWQLYDAGNNLLMEREQCLKMRVTTVPGTDEQYLYVENYGCSSEIYSLPDLRLIHSSMDEADVGIALQPIFILAGNGVYDRFRILIIREGEVVYNQMRYGTTNESVYFNYGNESVVIHYFGGDMRWPYELINLQTGESLPFELEPGGEDAGLRDTFRLKGLGYEIAPLSSTGEGPYDVYRDNGKEYPLRPEDFPKETGYYQLLPSELFLYMRTEQDRVLMTAYGRTAERNYLVDFMKKKILFESETEFDGLLNKYEPVDTCFVVGTVNDETFLYNFFTGKKTKIDGTLEVLGPNYFVVDKTNRLGAYQRKLYNHRGKLIQVLGDETSVELPSNLKPGGTERDRDDVNAAMPEIVQSDTLQQELPQRQTGVNDSPASPEAADTKETWAGMYVSERTGNSIIITQETGTGFAWKKTTIWSDGSSDVSDWTAVFSNEERTAAQTVISENWGIVAYLELGEDEISLDYEPKGWYVDESFKKQY